MKKIIEYVPIITVCLIYFGFCNLHFYYKEFKIDIYHYISNTEILLSFLPTIVVLASVFYVFAYSRLINHSDLQVEGKKKQSEQTVEVVENNGNKNKERKLIWRILLSLPLQVLYLLILEAIINFVLVYYFGYKTYDLQELNLYYALVFLLLLYLSTSLFTNQNFIKNNILLITVVSVIYVGLQIGKYRKFDADKIKDGKYIKNIEFDYNGKKISTSKQNIYIGQTQSHLFLYNIKNKTTSIYKTENIEFFIIK